MEKKKEYYLSVSQNVSDANLSILNAQLQIERVMKREGLRDSKTAVDFMKRLDELLADVSVAIDGVYGLIETQEVLFPGSTDWVQVEYEVSNEE